MGEEKAVLSWRNIPDLKASSRRVVLETFSDHEPLLRNTRLCVNGADLGSNGGRGSGIRCNFACVSVAEKGDQREFVPSAAQLLKHPLAVLAFVPKEVSLFAAGAVAGAVAKTFTAPLDRIKLLMQVFLFCFYLRLCLDGE